MQLIIKNMVCDRCKKVVKNELAKLNLHVNSIELGRVNVKESLDPSTLIKVKNMLEKEGFELLENPQMKTIEQIKNLIIQHIHHKKIKPEHQNFSDFLSDQIGIKYNILSKLFSSQEDITIEHFIISQKVERVKELLLYDEKKLNEIAWEMEYSSVQHLSAQFKKVTGMTPSTFRINKKHQRNSLDQI